MHTTSRILLLSMVGLLCLLLGSLDPVLGAPITSITDLNNFRDTRSLNDIGVTQGDTNQFGAEVVPNGFTSNTSIVATQGSFRAPATGSTPCGGFTVNPNFCALSPTFNAARTGSWSLTFLNGTDSATATTPSLTAAAAAAPVPFPVNVTISGSGTTPTLSWTVPGGFVPDVVRINVFDKSTANKQGVSDIIFSTEFAGSSTTSFTVPASAGLKTNNPYVLNIQLIETRDHTANTGNPNSNISRRSFSTFDFTALPAGAPPVVLLPTVGPTPDPSTGVGPTYQFHVGGLVPGGQIFVDPFVAIGYDYAIGVGDPNFASVLLPAVQSDPFLLSFLGEPGGQPLQLLPGVQFFFPQGGVDHFSVRGIHASAGLDPGDVTAFITGLTFSGSGEFTGTMIPVIAFAAVPEPSTLTLLISGSLSLLAGLTLRHRKRS